MSGSLDSAWGNEQLAAPPRRTSAVSPLAKEWWLFSPHVDLGVFLGSALVSLAALWVGARMGVLESGTPEWTWVPAVLLIDVAHVWATGFRVYFDTNELMRRPWLYALPPARTTSDDCS